ncbi:hypothetical protein PAXRUDRAFT_49993, partial [Paxillus rubicundulus Ve08.2h10]
VARIQRSNWQFQPADWNWGYKWTINKDATRKAQHCSREAELTCATWDMTSGPDAECWKSAVEEELLSLNSNHVSETIPIPEGVTPITSKPIFCIKHEHSGNVECYKVHIV